MSSTKSLLLFLSSFLFDISSNIFTRNCHYGEKNSEMVKASLGRFFVFSHGPLKKRENHVATVGSNSGYDLPFFNRNKRNVLGGVHTTSTIFENATLLLLSTLIRHENGGFRKHSSNRRNVKTPAFRFSVNGKLFENGVFRIRCRYDNRMISLRSSFPPAQI